jgi:hypothetical protein
MFGEQKCATGAKNSRNFRKNLLWVVHGAEHEGSHDCVDAGVLEGKSLCGCLHDPRVEATCGSSLSEPRRHMWIRFSQEDL